MASILASESHRSAMFKTTNMILNKVIDFDLLMFKNSLKGWLNIDVKVGWRGCQKQDNLMTQTGHLR